MSNITWNRNTSKMSMAETLQNSWHVSSPRQDDYPLWFSTISGGWSLFGEYITAIHRRFFHPLTHHDKQHNMQTLRQIVRRGGRIIPCVYSLFTVCFFGVRATFVFCSRSSTFFELWTDIAIPPPRVQHHQGQSFATARWAHITTTAHRVQDCCRTTQRSSQHGRMTQHSRIISAHCVRITAIRMLHANQTLPMPTSRDCHCSPHQAGFSLSRCDEQHSMSWRHTL